MSITQIGITMVATTHNQPPTILISTPTTALGMAGDFVLITISTRLDAAFPPPIGGLISDTPIVTVDGNPAAVIFDQVRTGMNGGMNLRTVAYGYFLQTDGSAMVVATTTQSQEFILAASVFRGVSQTIAPTAGGTQGESPRGLSNITTDPLVLSGDLFVDVITTSTFVTQYGIPSPHPTTLLYEAHTMPNLPAFSSSMSALGTTRTMGGAETYPIDNSATFASFTTVTVGLFAVPPIVCFSGKSKVLAKDIQTGKILEVLAENIEADIHEVYNTKKQQFVSVKYNIVTGPTMRYMRIKKDSLGENQPNEDFYITSGHVIMINGTPIKARHIPQAKRIKVKSENIYTICTDAGGPILINGLEVMSYKYQKWLEYAAKKNIILKNDANNNHVPLAAPTNSFSASQ